MVQGPPTASPVQYNPNCVTVSVGQSVVFQQADFAEHPLEPMGGTTPNPITLTSTGATVTFTFTSAGTYGFQCMLHPDGHVLERSRRYP